MRVHINLLYLNPLMLLAGLFACANGMANGVESTNGTVQTTENLEATVDATSTTTTVEPQKVKGLKNPNALLVEMAFKFKNSDGTPRDYAEVAAKYCKAAKAGDADAQYALGWMYANGRGVPANQNIAAQLYSKAAEQNHARAMESLAQLTNTAPKSALPACLLPDPPKVVVTIRNAPEQKAISEQTAALFYSQGHILKLVDKLAPRYKIDTNLVMAFIAVESGFNAKATSARNAQGLMQLIPATAQRFGVKNAYKAEDNIKGGLAYLQWLLAYYKGDVQLVAAAYNSGEGAVNKYKGVPPYAETRTYVKKIASLYTKASHPYREDLVKASPIVNLAKKSSI